jgi:hypothetical protein
MGACILCVVFVCCVLCALHHSCDGWDGMCFGDAVWCGASSWMTSAHVYHERVRPVWLGADGKMLHGTTFVPNGHWSVGCWVLCDV